MTLKYRIIGITAVLLLVFSGTLNAASEYRYSTLPSNISRENRFRDSFLRQSAAFDPNGENESDQGGLRGITPGGNPDSGAGQGEEIPVGNPAFLVAGFVLVYGIRLFLLSKKQKTGIGTKPNIFGCIIQTGNW